MATTKVYGFGSGILWGTQLVDANGSAIATPTPQRLGALQEMNISFDLSNKELYGVNQFALAVGRGTGKVAVKAKFAEVNMGAINSLYFGEPSNPLVGGVSQFVPVNDEGPTAIPVTPFTITVANSASISAGNPMVDLGVRFSGGALAGTYLTRVTGTPATGQYAVVLTTGVYTFASADNVSGYSVVIDYAYAPNTSTNKSILIANHILGSAPSFIAYGKVKYGANQVGIQLNQCVASKLTMPTKLDGFMINEFDFDCFADGSGNIGILTGPNL